MSLTVSVLIPYRHSGPERARALSWLGARYRALHPGWEVVIGHHDDGPWCKAHALDEAVAASSGELLVVADADVFVAPAALELAVRRAAWYPWVVPHARVHRLTEASTARLCAGPPVAEPGPYELDTPEQTVCPGGGLVVLRRSAYERAGGMDPRFVGWGYEDDSWAAQLDTILGGHHRGDALMWHLWHPRAREPRRTIDQRRDRHSGGLLRKRYLEAKGWPDEMATLLAERPPAPTATTPTGAAP